MISRSISIVNRLRASAQGPRPAAVRRTVDPWHARVEERLVLTRVEVAPDALLRVIATGRLLRAVRAGPAGVRMLRPQIHAFARCVHGHAADAPGRLNAQNRFEKFRVLYRRPPGRRLYRQSTLAGKPASASLLAISASRRERGAGSRGAEGAAHRARSPGRRGAVVA
jgi:hypothetical protein